MCIWCVVCVCFFLVGVRVTRCEADVNRRNHFKLLERGPTGNSNRVTKAILCLIRPYSSPSNTYNLYIIAYTGNDL
jgi:hypothetical protein